MTNQHHTDPARPVLKHRLICPRCAHDASPCSYASVCAPRLMPR